MSKVFYVFQIGEALGGTEAQTYHIALSKDGYKDFAKSVGMTETTLDKIPEGSVKLKISQAVEELAMIPLRVTYQVGTSKTNIKTQAATVLIPRDKIEEAIAPNGLRKKKYNGKTIVDLSLPRKRSYTF
jgi:hypothetical protein